MSEELKSRESRIADLERQLAGLRDKPDDADDDEPAALGRRADALAEPLRRMAEDDEPAKPTDLGARLERIEAALAGLAKPERGARPTSTADKMRTAIADTVGRDMIERYGFNEGGRK